MLTALKYISSDDYLEQERASTNKHEYFKGQIVAMAGASLMHNIIAGNIMGNIFPFLRGKPYRIFPSDLRVSASSKQSFTYPDATIVCNKPDMLDDQFDTVKNPSVIFEVVSPSTEPNDRGRKFFFYMQIPELKEYILISSTSYHVQTGRKQEDGSWKFEELNDLNTSLEINTIQFQFPLQEIYAGVIF